MRKRIRESDLRYEKETTQGSKTQWWRREYRRQESAACGLRGFHGKILIAASSDEGYEKQCGGEEWIR